MSLSDDIMYVQVDDPKVAGGKVSIVYPPDDGDPSQTMPCCVCEKELIFKPDTLKAKQICCKDCEADWRKGKPIPAAPLRIAKPTEDDLPAAAEPAVEEPKVATKIPKPKVAKIPKPKVARRKKGAVRMPKGL